MSAAACGLELNREGEILIVAPTADLRELEYERVEAGTAAALQCFSDPSIQHVVLDFSRTDYFGSTALKLLLRLLEKVKEREGRMALCSVSEHEVEILAAAQLADVWPVYPSRSEAIRRVRG